MVGRHRDHHDIRGACPVERFAKLLSDGDSWCHPVVGVIRRQVLAETGLIGGYGGADHVLLAELALRGEFHEIPAPLFRRRIYAGESPSLQANRSPEEVAAWFDPRPRKCVVLPRWRLLVEHVRAVRRAPLTRLQRLACYRLLKSAPFSENWGAGLLAGEIRRALRRWCWDRHTLGALRGAQHFLPHRAWALLSGLRRGDGQRVGLAFAPPGAATHAALLGFVAECLSRRSDPESRELLSEWLNGTREPHRTAAAAAVGKREVAAEVAGTHAIMSNEPCRSV